MPGKTISITIPDQLEENLQKEADKLGVSRSRYIGNILLDWQKDLAQLANDCVNNQMGFCINYDMKCEAPQSEAESCAGYGTLSNNKTNG